jgi:hypothetical protein
MNIVNTQLDILEITEPVDLVIDCSSIKRIKNIHLCLSIFIYNSKIGHLDLSKCDLDKLNIYDCNFSYLVIGKSRSIRLDNIKGLKSVLIKEALSIYISNCPITRLNIQRGFQDSSLELFNLKINYLKIPNQFVNISLKKLPLNTLIYKGQASEIDINKCPLKEVNLLKTEFLTITESELIGINLWYKTKFLNLSYNKLEKLKIPSSCHTAILNNNFIKSINIPYELRWIELYSNSLEEFRCKDINTIDLSYNPLKTVHIKKSKTVELNSCKKLKEVTICSNDVMVFSSKMDYIKIRAANLILDKVSIKAFDIKVSEWINVGSDPISKKLTFPKRFSIAITNPLAINPQLGKFIIELDN